MDQKHLNKLKLWVLGKGFSPDVLDTPMAISAIEQQDGVALVEVINRNGEPLDPQESKYSLRLSGVDILEAGAMVRDDDSAFLFAVMLGGSDSEKEWLRNARAEQEQK